MTQRVHLGKRYSVKMAIPPERIFEVAHDRTEGIVGYFVASACMGNPILWQQQLSRMAVSCYLQGINDAVDAESKVREK